MTQTPTVSPDRLYDAVLAHEDRYRYAPSPTQIAQALGEDEHQVRERLNALADDWQKPFYRIGDPGPAARFRAVAKTASGIEKDL